MNSEEIRDKFLKFFEKRGHKIIPSASLVPDNDPSVLFNTAGMLPLVPYLLGESHPEGKRLVNFQKCLRTNDIDEVGDDTHLTFFEMLGNWSLGDYFKKEAIEWSYKLLTDKEEGFGLDPSRLYISVFEGDNNAPRDDESASHWRAVGIPEHRIYFMPASENWWQPGENGPCGPDSEMRYDTTKNGLGDLKKEEYIEADKRQDLVEIWNDVFMEYKMRDGKVTDKLVQKNVDTGAGLERLTAVLQGKKSVFDTDLFEGLINESSKLSNDIRNQRIISDHFRSSVFLIADGILPSNTDRGYVLRRLIRRLVTKTDKKNIDTSTIERFINVITSKYANQYPQLALNSWRIQEVINDEMQKFSKTLEKGLRELEKVDILTGDKAFSIYETYGLPLEVQEEVKVVENRNDFYKKLNLHQEKSRTASKGMFKGGLGGQGDKEIKYHTTTHLLNAALRKTLGEHIEQRGSNINSERLRFDFSHSQKLTEQEKKSVEEQVNAWIGEAHDVNCEEIDLEDAKAQNAIGVFGEKYGKKVKVYTIGRNISKEICGGPHVKNTSELGRFKIIKEEASSAGIRRIKAILE